MPTKDLDPEVVAKELARPFNPITELEWRVQSYQTKKDDRSKLQWALVFAYVDSRAIQNRLDEVSGIDNWQNRVTPVQGEGFLAEIGLLISGRWVWKGDGADRSNQDAFKGGVSGALKRAGYLWGIGRYLYDIPSSFPLDIVYDRPGPDFWIPTTFKENPRDNSSRSHKAWFLPPILPKEMLPEGFSYPSNFNKGGRDRSTQTKPASQSQQQQRPHLDEDYQNLIAGAINRAAGDIGKLTELYRRINQSDDAPSLADKQAGMERVKRAGKAAREAAAQAAQEAPL